MTNETKRHAMNEPQDPIPSERRRRGRDMLARVDGEAGVQVVERLAAHFPDFANYVLEYPFGDIYARPGLGLRERELAVVAALTAMGNAAPQLLVHLKAALHVGCTPREIVETVGEAGWVTARALAPLDRLARWCLPLLRPGGALLAVKGEQAEAELARHARAVRQAGGTSARVVRCAAHPAGSVTAPPVETIPGTEVSVVVIQRGRLGQLDGRGAR